MKYVILVMLALATISPDLYGQAKRTVLVEEFTNTESMLSAEVDPMLETMELDNFNDIILIKWHTSWPNNNDPFFVSLPSGDDRAKKLYNIEYNPYLCLNGSPLGGFGVVQLYDKHTLYNEIKSKVAKPSPYDISVTQEIVGDSLIALVTVKCLGTPISGELRLGVAITERYNSFVGTNGSKYQRNIVRRALPGLTTEGEIAVSAQYPAFSISNGETKTIRFTTLVNTSWKQDQLVSVAFIQDAFTDEVYNTNYSLPVKLSTSSDRVVFVPSDTSLNISFTNVTTSPMGLRAELIASTIPNDWNVFLSGALSDGSFSVPANGTTNVSLRSTATSNKQGYYPYSMRITTLNDMYIGTYYGIAWGKDNNEILVDAGADESKMNILANGVSLSGDYTTVIVPYQILLTHFSNWKDFRTVLIHTGNSFGIHPYEATWDLIKNFTTSGGNVLITSNDKDNVVGNYYDAIHDVNNPSDFIQLMQGQIRDNLHIEPAPFSAGSSWSKVNGISGDELSSGFSTTITGRTGIQEFTLLDGATAAFKNENDETIGIRVRKAKGKLVYLPFGVDNVAIADRNTITKRVMDWFEGVGSVKVSEKNNGFIITNYPNPAKDVTVITYSIPERGVISLSLYDLLGKKVGNVIDGEINESGTYETEYDTTPLPSGEYIYRLSMNGRVVSGKLTVSK